VPEPASPFRQLNSVSRLGRENRIQESESRHRVTGQSRNPQWKRGQGSHYFKVLFFRSKRLIPSLGSRTMDARRSTVNLTFGGNAG